MGWISGIVVYVLIWWVVIFAVLPWGNRAPSQVQEGNVASAPEKPNIGKKFLMTSLISALIWCGIYILVKMNVIDFHLIAKQMSAGETNL